MQAYAPKKPLYSGAMDTQHTLDVVVGAPLRVPADGCARTIALLAVYAPLLYNFTMALLTRCAARPDRRQAGGHAGGGRGGRWRAAAERGDRVRPGPRRAESGVVSERETVETETQ